MFDDIEILKTALRGQKTVRSSRQAREIAEAAVLKEYNTGEPIAKAGELGNELYYIVSGSVDIFINGHLWKNRPKGELVGEMSLIDPGGVRNADIVAAMHNTWVAVVGTKDFHEMASRNPEHWRCVANELAQRLRQRDEMFVPPNAKPVIFFASSSEGAKLHLDAIREGLASEDWELRPWTNKNIFRPSVSTLKNLEDRANESDFAIALITADDIRESRESIDRIARDNVIFEAGLFMGALEAKRVFLLIEANADLKLPTDLNGISMLYFSNQPELSAKLSEITNCIKDAGLMFRLCRPVS